MYEYRSVAPDVLRGVNVSGAPGYPTAGVLDTSGLDVSWHGLCGKLKVADERSTCSHDSQHLKLAAGCGVASVPVGAGGGSVLDGLAVFAAATSQGKGETPTFFSCCALCRCGTKNNTAGLYVVHTFVARRPRYSRSC